MTPRHATVLGVILATSVLHGAPAQAQPVQGFVDLHSHLTAEHSFGGGWFWGTVEGPIDWAVRRCDGNVLRTHAALLFPVLAEFMDASDTGLHLFKRRGYDRRRCRYFLGIRVPGTCPKPHFENWPMWDAIAHQQMWHGWLRQAHQGGLRVMVVSLVESNFLCSNTALLSRRYGCDEMSSVYRQASYARDFAARNAGWVGIARTPAEARSLIHQGKLALVLSVEVTRLFPSGDSIHQLDQLRDVGVSSLQLVHHANSRFAGAAPIPKLMQTANQTEYLWDLLFGLPLGSTELTQIDDMVCFNSAGARGTCDGIDYLNSVGLLPEGATLAGAMMGRGMLVDVAHLSRKALEDMYQLAVSRGYYPLLYSHAHMWDTIDPAEERHEKYIRLGEIQLINNTGGMVGLRTGPERTVQYAGSGVDNRCQGSSRSFAQSLVYAVDHGLSVGFGADLNGFISQTKPRLSPACPADASNILHPGPVRDVHWKGLAHVGLLPDLIADLQAVGVNGYYIDHLNNSAERFLQMWERSVSLSHGSRPNLARQASAWASSTYCAGGPEHCYSPARIHDGNRNTTVGGYHSWTNVASGLPQWVELTWANPIDVNSVELYTSDGYRIRDYDIQYWTGSTWGTAVAVTWNTALTRVHSFRPPIVTSRLRVLGRRGPDNQSQYVRINELEVY